MTNFTMDFGFVREASSFVPLIHGGEHSDGGPVAVIENILEGLSREAMSSWSLFGGIETLGSNVHPLLVHFPIAFLLAFVIFDSYGLFLKRLGARRLANAFLYLGAIAAPITAYAGLIAEDLAKHGSEVHELIEWHERAGLTVSALAIILALGRRFFGVPNSAMGEALNGALSAIMAVALIMGADLGGLMVYHHGLGVSSLQTANDHVHP